MWEKRNDEIRRRALEELLDGHGNRLYGMLARLTRDRAAVSDLFQELFLRLGRTSQFFRARDKPAYAFRTAIHLAMEWRRKRKRNWVHVHDCASGMNEPSLDPSPLQRMIEIEDYEGLLNAMGQLPEEARDLFVMRFIEQESYETIAKRVDKTAHQVRGLCHSAVRKLRILLGPIEESRSHRETSKTGESS